MQCVKMFVAALVVCLLAVPGAASAKDKKRQKVPAINYIQYNLDPGPSQTQAKSSIEISLQVIRISDIYKYPGLFSFNVEDIAKFSPKPDEVRRTLQGLYPKGPDGLSWEDPFNTPDGRLALLLLWAKIVNNTDHILRMKDARVYLIPEGKEPLSAYAKVDDLLGAVDIFEIAANQYLAAQGKKSLFGGLMKLQLNNQLPRGFYRALVLGHKDSYKLINDFDKEILPGFTYEGLLVFPSAPDIQGTAKISFFDITTKMDVAGNPTEKARFDFALKREEASMWYDGQEKMWKEGVPASE